MVDNYGVIRNKRVVGEITKQLTPSTFEVHIADNATWKHHVDQIYDQNRGSDNRALTLTAITKQTKRY